jgi:hypothetical protein
MGVGAYCAQHQKRHEKPISRERGTMTETQSDGITQSWIDGYDVFPDEVNNIPIKERGWSLKPLLVRALRTKNNRPIPPPKSWEYLSYYDPFYYVSYLPIFYCGKIAIEDIAFKTHSMNREAVGRCSSDGCYRFLRYEPMYDEFIYQVVRDIDKLIHHWFYVYKVDANTGSVKLVGLVKGQHDDINKNRRFIPMMLAPVVHNFQQTQN